MLRMDTFKVMRWAIACEHPDKCSSEVRHPTTGRRRQPKGPTRLSSGEAPQMMYGRAWRPPGCRRSSTTAARPVAGGGRLV